MKLNEHNNSLSFDVRGDVSRGETLGFDVLHGARDVGIIQYE